MFGRKRKQVEIEARMEGIPIGESYWSIVKRQFKKNGPAVWSLRFLFVMLFVALIADFVANDKPIVCKIDGEVYWPVFNSYAVDMGLSSWEAQFTLKNWNEHDYEFVLFAPIPYSSSSQDKRNMQFVGPSDKQRVASTKWTHWLGTDLLGRDVLAGLIHGSRIAIWVGVVSMSIASVIGILLGAFAGYFGDDRFKLSRGGLLIGIPAVLAALYYGVGVPDYVGASSFVDIIVRLLVAGLILVAAYFLTQLVNKIPVLAQKVTIAADILVMRLIEVINSIPTIFLLLAVIAILDKPSLNWIMAIIGLISWTGIARFIRAELLRVRSLEYIEASQALGYSESRVLFRHAIPNALTPVLIAIAFGIASAVLLEAVLSFLGLLSAEVVTWGSLLNYARSAPEAWWLATFPGFAIFITVTIFNLLGEGLTDALDPRLKQ